MKVEQRGTPQYSVWSGRYQDGQLLHLNEPQFDTDDLGHRSIKPTYYEALIEIFNLTDGGKDIGSGPYIKDST